MSCSGPRWNGHVYRRRQEQHWKRTRTTFSSAWRAWEIAIKVGVGKWPEARDLLFDFEHHMGDAGFEMLPITVAHVRTAGLMGGIHRDPFDRVLAAQAMIDGLTLVTIDTNLASLGAACIW